MMAICGCLEDFPPQAPIMMSGIQLTAQLGHKKNLKILLIPGSTMQGRFITAKCGLWEGILIPGMFGPIPNALPQLSFAQCFALSHFFRIRILLFYCLC